MEDKRMKTILRNLLFLLLAMASGMAIPTSNAQVADEPLPPEVEVLIGMRIPPKIVGKRGGDIPNFVLFGGGMLNKQIGNEMPRAELVFDEGIVSEKWPVFIVSASHTDRTLEILDVRLLPKKLISWRYANGKIKGAGKGDHFIFSTDCLYAKGDGRIIFGLEDPTVEHKGFSTRIERAWEIDQQSGHIKTIPTRNITCAILGE
jgi:hypothetical protein